MSIRYHVGSNGQIDQASGNVYTSCQRIERGVIYIASYRGEEGAQGRHENDEALLLCAEDRIDLLRGIHR